MVHGLRHLTEGLVLVIEEIKNRKILTFASKQPVVSMETGSAGNLSWCRKILRK